ncbi:MAG TPA: ABC transporter ATP-binding protein [Thermoleophilaceae bacterium]
MTPLLEVRDLRIAFDTEAGRLVAADGVSFEVAPGGALGIVGESGSGKSVTSLAVMGLQRGAEVSGEVVFEGRDLLALSEPEMRHVRGNEIAMVFQDPLSSLHPLKRVGAQVAEAVRAHRPVSRAAARARVLELLTLVELRDPPRVARAYPHELSGGMRQRAMIAVALANEPRLLLADEPTTALDVTVQAQILALLGRLREELGMALVIVTHDLGVIAATAERVAVMYAGRIVERAPAATIFRAPEHPYTWGLLRSVPRLDTPRDAPLMAIEGSPPSPLARPAGCSFHPRCPYVRDAHRRVDPPLEPAEGDPAHEVACLLPARTRRELWAKAWEDR